MFQFNFGTYQVVKFQDRKSRRAAECSDGDNVKVGLKEKQVTESGDSIGYESGMHADNTRWRHQEERL